LEKTQREHEALIAQLHGVRDELQGACDRYEDRLRAVAEDARQREEELRAMLLVLRQRLDQEETHAREARDRAAALATQLETVQATYDARETSHAEERRALTGELTQARTSTAALASQAQQRTAEQETERTLLAQRIGLLETQLRQRISRIEQLEAEAIRSHVEVQDMEARTAQRVGVLEAELDGRTSEMAALRREAESAARARQRSDAEFAAARAAVEMRAADVQAHCSQLENALADAEKRSQLAEQREAALTAQLLEFGNDRSTLSLRVDELTALTAELDRECERLRRDRGSGEELRRLKADNTRLETKIVDLERQRNEAAQRHSAAVAGYMVELNQRSEVLQARETELQKMAEELGLLRQTCEDAASELAEQRQQQTALERQLAELKKAPPAKASLLEGSLPTSAPARPVAPAAAPTRSGSIRIEKPRALKDQPLGPVTIIHLDDNANLCETVSRVIARLPDAQYLNALDTDPSSSTQSRLLVVNLLYRAVDPRDAIRSFLAGDSMHTDVLAYCTEGANGFVFGTADYFSQPLDPDACVARLMESRGAIQRLLIATEDFAVVGSLREVLSRMRSSVSAALDLRQVIDLLPMVEPDVVLVDLSLPRGEGLRVVGRLRADPKTRDLPLGILLTAPGNPTEFRQQALRAARELSMEPTDLVDVIGRRLSVRAPAKASAALRAGALA
jgi:CheY-like chemotaxis protein